MASKYPSVTVKSKKGLLSPWKGPGTVPTLKPSTVKAASKAMMGFLSPGDAAKIAIAKLPAKYLKPDPKLLVKAFQGFEVPDQGDSPMIQPKKPITPSDAYWTITSLCTTAYWNFGDVRWSQYSAGCTAVGNGNLASFPQVPEFTTLTSIRRVAHVRLAGGYTRVNSKVANRKTGAPVPTPTFTPAKAFAEAFPMEFPMEMPLAWPQAQPLVVPKRPVWTKPFPGEEPTTDPEIQPDYKKGSPAPGQADVFVLPPMPFPFIRITPGQDLPFVPTLPGVIVEPVTGGDFDAGKNWYAPKPSTDYGRPAPPKAFSGGRPRPTIEKKADIQFAGLGLAWALTNTVTETVDFIGAMHDSLPKHRQLSEKASKRQRVHYMMTNWKIWREIDLAEGLQNFINMQIGDAAAALGSQSIKKVTREMNMVTGLDRALRAHSDLLGEIDPDDHSNWAENIPTLDIDRETGVISINGPLGALRWKYRRR